MVNYKSKRKTITFAGVEYPIPEAAVIKFLHDDTASATAADSMFDSNDNLVYAVTAGKTFHLLGVRIFHDETISAGSLVVSSGDTEDAETAAIITLKVGATANIIVEVPMDKTFAAGKFVVYNPSAAVVENIQMIGYEI